ncbi:Predicted esterase of the alpha-beta hydrolase superfamily [Moritella viscosa]|uniref:Predicted esterase of the alpha-beta hydrolase superfamily n=1 Tax=Moritella viscosa TaxID=80854 RepID=A0A090I9S9_9GAMM|nr:patatin family protein [Moritella viscosa]CED58710.1 putative phospholipase [Moritella viscosa]SGY84395.1 Predicted esterase of the alpha-beta hydrolase superfamily [Moritella viscosa]SHN97532.1 Predicted esterase of the alpha-beta hydrolase superfamily [Moritella viscosa]SHN97533.1 Predicted esterase of the alpha-beta hydrolase superfamily [Moritella viscosa]SHN97534.1 Predicted esterase of the alpha-beta hydrolase superfamily [Moritella viscosa]
MIKTALVVEGGGMRSVFTAGVLDTFLEHGYDPFDLFIGSSAGTLNLSAFIAGQKKYSVRLINHLAKSTTFVNWTRFLRGGNAMELRELHDLLELHDPIDLDKAKRRLNSRPFVITSCDRSKGQVSYQIAEPNQWFQQIIASCALPIVFRPGVKLGNDIHIDGGLVDPIPVKKAVDLGAKNIIVIRTRTRRWVEKLSVLERLLTFWVRHDTVLTKLLDNYSKKYNSTCEFMRNPPAGVNIIEIAPDNELQTPTLTRQVNTLEGDYSAGIKAATLFLQRH